MQGKTCQEFRLVFNYFHYMSNLGTQKKRRKKNATSKVKKKKEKDN